MSPENPISKQPLLRYVNRQQRSWRAADVEKLIAEDHAARAIEALLGWLNLSGFYQALRVVRKKAGERRSLRNRCSAGGCTPTARGWERRGKWRDAASWIRLSSG
jgi:hypothetical protein